MDAKAEGARETEAKARVFISYSRKDMAFADRLEAALKARGFEPLIDRTEIYAFEDWWKRIKSLIGSADTVVFVLSPDAVSSEVALKEVTHAAALNKRFAPIVCRPVEDSAVPEELRRLNFIFFDDAARFESSCDQLAAALRTDIGWIREHTRFGEAAHNWAAAGKPGGLLLRSPMLEEGERWIASRPRGAPEPTGETQLFVAESRRGASRRRNVLTGSLAAGLLMALMLAGAALWQRQIADQQRERAERTLTAATDTADRLVSDLAQRLKEAVGIPPSLRRDILDRAQKLQEQLSAAGEVTPDLQRSEGTALDEVAQTLLTLDDPSGAFAAADRSRQISEKLLAARPEDPDLQRDLAVVYSHLGDASTAQGKTDAALDYYQESLHIADKLAVGDSKNLRLQNELGEAYDRVGEALKAQGKLVEALQMFRAGHDIAAKLAAARPDNLEFQYQLGISHDRIAGIFRAQGDLAGALSELEADRQIVDGLISAKSDNTRWLHDSWAIHKNIGDIKQRQSQSADALSSYRQALGAIESLTRANAEVPEWQHDLANTYEGMGDLLFRLGQAGDALEYFRKAVETFDKKLAHAESTKLDWRRGGAIMATKAADVLLAQGKRAVALDEYRKALGIFQVTAAAQPDNPDWQWDLMNIQWRLATLGDSPAERYQAIVTALSKLRDENKLKGDMSAMLAAAQAQLAKFGH